MLEPRSILKFVLAIGQLCSTASMRSNLASCKILVQKAAEAGAKALFLPEAADYIATNPTESVALARSMDSSPFVLGLRDLARKSHLAISVGIHTPAKSGKLLNRSCWINEKGEIAPGYTYDKLHLFDYAAMKESSSVEAGKTIIPPIDTVVGRVGLMICFDLRFPEISLSLKHQKAQILTYPSAFTVPTGIAHWEFLLRARAIETQTYVIAAAQVGAHNEKRTSYGHSMIIDPWGRVLIHLPGEGTEPQIGIVDINLEYQEKIQSCMPLIRRTDVYSKA